MARVISLLYVFIFILNVAACSIKPVKKETLNADKSYADFSGVAAKVGEKAPDFSLLDGEEKTVSLSDFREKQAVMLLFYRGEWCPYCMDQLSNYQALLPELKKHNIQLLAISPDNISAVQNTQRRFGQSYIFLSDKNLQVTQLYGIGSVKNLPHPALFLISKEGVLEWYYASTDHVVRPASDQVEKIINKIFNRQVVK